MKCFIRLTHFPLKGSFGWPWLMNSPSWNRGSSSGKDAQANNKK
jgi:hypothetical protein